MTEGLTKLSGQGRDEIYVGFGEHVPPRWEWTTDPSKGWSPAKVPDAMRSVIVMCRARKMFWNLRATDDDQVSVFGGDEEILIVTDIAHRSLAERVVAFLNGQDPHQQLIYAIADAQANTGQNMLPLMQAAKDLAVQTRSRIESYG